MKTNTNESMNILPTNKQQPREVNRRQQREATGLLTRPLHFLFTAGGKLSLGPEPQNPTFETFLLNIFQILPQTSKLTVI